MPGEGSDEPASWFRIAEDDLSAARILLSQDGPTAISAFHLQQAVEKALKGFLISRGWGLRRLHDLDLLLTEALRHEPTLERYSDLCEELDGFYVGERYPDVGAPPIAEEILVERATEVEAMLDELSRLCKED